MLGLALAAVAITVTVFSGGVDIPLLATSLALFGQGVTTVAEVSIGSTLITGCPGGVATQIVTSIADSVGIN